MKELRYFESGDFFDTLVLVLDPTGDVHKGVSISNSYFNYDMFSANQGLLEIAGDYYFAGWSYGYKTRLQEL